MSVRVAISGAGGRMGRALLEAVGHSGDVTLAASFDIGGDVRAALSGADVLIDFTRPEGTLEHLRACVEAKRAMVIGTTGFDAAQLARIRDAARAIAIVMAPNMSVGVNVALRLVEMASRSLGPEYDVEVFEQTLADLLALFRVKLCRPEIVFVHDGRELQPVICRGQGDVGGLGLGVIRMHEVDETPRLNSGEQRILLPELELVPAHMRNDHRVGNAAHASGDDIESTV